MQNFTPPKKTGTPKLPLPDDLPKDGSDAAMVLLLMAESKLSRELSGMLESNGYRYQAMEDPAELWKIGKPTTPACLLCSHPLRDDVTGYQILEGIKKRSWPLPTLLVARQWDVPEVVNAMKAGAENCLSLPLKTSKLVKAVEQGLLRARQQWDQSCAIADVRERADTLDSREREVVKRVLRGYLNKEIADQLDLALVTIKVYRSRAMKKLQAGNACELAHIASLAGLCDANFSFRRD